MKFIDTLVQINEGTAWKSKKDAAAYCKTMNDVYGMKCKPVQVGKEWDYWQVEYENQNKITEDNDINSAENVPKNDMEKIVKLATNSLTVSLGKSIDDAVDEVTDKVVGPKTKQIASEELREALGNFSQDIESSDDFVDAVIDDLNKFLADVIGEELKATITEKTTDKIQSLVKENLLKIQFKSETNVLADKNPEKNKEEQFAS